MGLWDDTKLLLLKSWKYMTGASWKKEYENIIHISNFKIDSNDTISKKFGMKDFMVLLEKFNKLKDNSYEIKRDEKNWYKARNVFLENINETENLIKSIRDNCEIFKEKCRNYQKQANFSGQLKKLEAEFDDLNKKIKNSVTSQEEKIKLEESKKALIDTGKPILEKNVALDTLYSTLDRLSGYMAAKMLKILTHKKQAEEMDKKYSQKNP